jgi:hypothetical protein
MCILNITPASSQLAITSTFPTVLAFPNTSEIIQISLRAHFQHGNLSQSSHTSPENTPKETRFTAVNTTGRKIITAYGWHWHAKLRSLNLGGL